jgi:hypothetical protein
MPSTRPRCNQHPRYRSVASTNMHGYLLTHLACSPPLASRLRALHALPRITSDSHWLPPRGHSYTFGTTSLRGQKAGRCYNHIWLVYNAIDMSGSVDALEEDYKGQGHSRAI